MLRFAVVAASPKASRKNVHPSSDPRMGDFERSAIERRSSNISSTISLNVTVLGKVGIGTAGIRGTSTLRSSAFIRGGTGKLSFSSKKSTGKMVSDGLMYV